MTQNLSQTDTLLATLQSRFEKYIPRHPGISWADVQKKLLASPKKLESISLMESTGGQPDVVGFDSKTGEYLFFDCSPESPTERRSFCYDTPALDSRKANKPKNSALGLAAQMGTQLLTEDQYRYLQTLGVFDTKTSSWLSTPDNIRKLGGAIFADRRYNHVFVYHNGAESYYASRGFRTCLYV